jgi:two-component system chemotaxis sensor kinase CheA
MFLNLSPMIHELASDLNKARVDYSVEGDALNISTEMVYTLRDAVIHIVRNSLDHGIETEDERISKSKNPVARLNVGIKSEGSKTVIEISDDGSGIDHTKLVERALKLNMIAHDSAGQLSEQDRINLAFLPNLSTKEQVSAISGRGVGMDAVKTIVTSLNGEVMLISKRDHGSTVRIEI